LNSPGIEASRRIVAPAIVTDDKSARSRYIPPSSAR
jgi:hypothetical protein